MGEINVVPYIDVMLVLLVIFMITAPMLNQSIEVQLPIAGKGETITDAPAKIIVVEVAADGGYRLGYGEQKPSPVADVQTLVARVVAYRQLEPNSDVYLGGDARVPYVRVLSVMDALKGAGVAKVGLLTKPAEQ